MMRAAVHTGAEQSTEKRMRWLDAARGIAMLFILLGHAGVQIPGVSRFALLFYVPVFFVAAGYLYRTKEESLAQFAKRRAKRLLLPYFGYNLFLFLCYLLKETWTVGTAQEWLRPLLGILYGRNSLYPPGAEPNLLFLTVWNSPLWFLPALFLSELAFAAVCRLTGENGRKLTLGMILCLAAGAVLQKHCPILLPWSLDSVGLFVGFLWCGYLLRRKKVLEETDSRPWISVLLLLAAAGCALLNGEVNLSVGIWGAWILPGAGGMACASILMLALCRWLEWRAEAALWVTDGLALVGQSTMAVLGLHLFVFMWFQGLAEILFPGVMQSAQLPGEALRIVMSLATLALLTVCSRTAAACRKGSG